MQCEFEITYMIRLKIIRNNTINTRHQARPYDYKMNTNRKASEHKVP